MRIASAASAFPPNRYTQQEIASALKSHWADKLQGVQVLDRLHSRVGVETRHLALPMDQYEALTTWGKANNAWIRVAEELGTNALCRALSRAGLAVSDLSALFFVSVTGISSPSIDAKLINRMGLPTNMKRVPIFGLGCVAGAAGIARAADYVRAFPDQAAALVAVELCSLTWQRDDLSVANILSSGLFGDGAAAVIVAGNGKVRHGPEIIDTRSTFYPGTEYVMGWNVSETGFRIALSPEVPDVIAQHLGGNVDEFLDQHGLSRSDIGCWIMHNGGPKVLEATANALGLPRTALETSWKWLKAVGNLSSASVLVVLEDIMTHSAPPAGTYSVLGAMGPGFCSELVLLRW